MRAILLLFSVGLCAAFPHYMKNHPHSDTVEDVVEKLAGDVQDFERQDAVGDAQIFLNNWTPAADGGHKALNALIPCPVIASIYNKFPQSEKGAIKVSGGDDAIEMCKDPASCADLFNSCVTKDHLIEAMIEKGGAGDDSASGIHGAVPHCDDGSNPADPKPCHETCKADSVPIFKLHSYTKAIHGSSTRIRYDRVNMKPGFRQEQFDQIWTATDTDNSGGISPEEFSEAINKVFIQNTAEDSSIFQLHAQAVFASLAISYVNKGVDQKCEMPLGDLLKMYMGDWVEYNGKAFWAWGTQGVVMRALVGELRNIPTKVKAFFIRAAAFFGI